MLLAVNMGRPQSPRSVLSRRRSMRRLLLVSLWCIVAFTRNPSWIRFWGKVSTSSTPGTAERFRVFYEIPPPTIGGFASLGIIEVLAVLHGGREPRVWQRRA